MNQDYSSPETREATMHSQFGNAPESSASMQTPPTEALMQYFKDYARERPEVLAMWCFGIGFVLGWKLKPW
jgi:hypothetical protein